MRSPGSPAFRTLWLAGELWPNFHMNRIQLSEVIAIYWFAARGLSLRDIAKKVGR